MRKALPITVCAIAALSTTHTQAADLKEYLTDTAGGTAADFYFPFEHSFLSTLQSVFLHGICSH